MRIAKTILLCAPLALLDGGCATMPTADARFTLSWTNDMLTVSSPKLPGGKLDIWYLEAFCHSGAKDKDWNQTKIPHQTRLLRASADGRELQFETVVQTNVIVRHEVVAERDSIKFSYTFRNAGTEFADIQWFQPACIRVGNFTGRDQQNYPAKSFVFTERGLTPLNETRRTTNALYLGGQVYLPPQTKAQDANPRPICNDRVTNGLIGCFSQDGRQILATASSATHELFEGICVCLHSDPRVGGLHPAETKRILARLYLLSNDSASLEKRYRRDFPPGPS